MNSLFRGCILEGILLGPRSPLPLHPQQSKATCEDSLDRALPLPITSSISHKSYRPLTTLSYRLEWCLRGDSPDGFHSTNVAIDAPPSWTNQPFHRTTSKPCAFSFCIAVRNFRTAQDSASGQPSVRQRGVDAELLDADELEAGGAAPVGMSSSLRSSTAAVIATTRRR